MGVAASYQWSHPGSLWISTCGSCHHPLSRIVRQFKLQWPSRSNYSCCSFFLLFKICEITYWFSSFEPKSHVRFLINYTYLFIKRRPSTRCSPTRPPPLTLKNFFYWHPLFVISFKDMKDWRDFCSMWSRNLILQF